MDSILGIVDKADFILIQIQDIPPGQLQQGNEQLRLNKKEMPWLLIVWVPLKEQIA